MRFAIPQFQALYHAIAFQWNRAASATLANYVAHLKRFGLAIAIVDNNAVEFDGRVVYADLQEAITTGGFANFNIVVIMLAIHVCLAKINPVFGVRRRSHVNQECCCKERNQNFLHFGIALLSKLRLINSGTTPIMVPLREPVKLREWFRWMKHRARK